MSQRKNIVQWLMASLFIVLFVWTQAVADARSEAKAALEEVINKVVDIIKEPGFTKADTRQGLIDRAEDQIKKIFDFEEFSARTLGGAWKSFTPDQKERFNEAFAELLRNNYLDKIDDYNGEKINYLGEVASSKGDKVEVQTAIALDNKNVLLNYYMLKKDSWKVYDVIVEGVSLVQNYRSQFRDLLQKGTSPDELIAKVKEQAVKIKSANDARSIK